MNKTLLVLNIIEKLEKIHQAALNATQTAIDDATDEETVPEHKYDTLALEASYLAHGQAMRVQECEADIYKYKKLPIRSFDAHSEIGLGALVELMDEADKSTLFFLGPCSGGVTIIFDGEEITLITTQSPLGKTVIGKKVGDEIILRVAGKQICYEVMNIN